MMRMAYLARPGWKPLIECVCRRVHDRPHTPCTILCPCGTEIQVSERGKDAYEPDGNDVVSNGYAACYHNQRRTEEVEVPR